MKKDDLADFLMENLWQGGGIRPKKKSVRLKIKKHRKKNLLDEKNPVIQVPMLRPEKRTVSQKAIPKVIPKAIEKNVDTVVDWANWLESVNDVDLRRKSSGGKTEKRNQKIVGRKIDRGRRKVCFERICETILDPRR